MSLPPFVHSFIHLFIRSCLLSFLPFSFHVRFAEALLTYGWTTLHNYYNVILSYYIISMRLYYNNQGFPGGAEVKASACSVGDLGSIPGSGRSRGEGNGKPLQDSCLENPVDGGVWWATVHGVTKSQTQLSDFTSLHSIFENC